MDIRVGAVHPNTAKTRALKSHGAIARPRLRRATLAAKGESHDGGPAPFPFTEEPAQFRRSDGAQRGGVEAAFEVEAKIIRRFEQVGRELAGFMSQPKTTQHSALAVPGKISGQLQERHSLCR